MSSGDSPSAPEGSLSHEASGQWRLPLAADQLLVDQVGQLYQNMTVGLMASVINSLLIGFALRRVVPASLMLTWVGINLLIALVRYGHYLRVRGRPLTTDNARRRKTAFVAGVASTGVNWGAGAVLLFPVDSVAHQVFLAFVFGGMVAGSVGTLSSVLAAYHAFSLPVLVPLMVRFLLVSDELQWTMGLMAALFIALMATTARRMHRTTIRLFQYRAENTDLVGFLAEEKDKAERLNKQLREENSERKNAEQDLLNYREYLAEMVQQRTRDYEGASTQLQAALTKQRELELGLNTSRRNFQALADISGEAVLLVIDGRIELYNRKAETLLASTTIGLKRASLSQFILGGPLEERPTDPGDPAGPRLLEHGATVRLLNARGQEVWGKARAVKLIWEDRPARLYSIRDYSTLMKMEQDMQSALQAATVLAANIDDDFSKLTRVDKGRIAPWTSGKELSYAHKENLKRLENHLKSIAGLAVMFHDF